MHKREAQGGGLARLHQRPALFQLENKETKRHRFIIIIIVMVNIIAYMLSLKEIWIFSFIS